MHEGAAAGTDRSYDPELAAAVEQLPQIDLRYLHLARAMTRRLATTLTADPTGVTVTDREISGPAGAPTVRVRISRPAGVREDAPCVLNMHGGGFVLGDLDLDHGLCLDIARQVGAVVVSVDYRLAPEYPFPAGLEDCYAALAWLSTSADELGIDPARIAVHGTSAGGGLAAAVALLARDREGPALSFQFLDIPELDDRLTTASMEKFTGTPLWNRPNAQLSWRYYLGEAAGSADVPAYAAPARAVDLSGLPPAYISAMEFDPLRDEGMAYAKALIDAGVPAELHLFAGTFHASALVQHAAISRRQQNERIFVLRRALDRRPDRRPVAVGPVSR